MKTKLPFAILVAGAVALPFIVDPETAAGQKATECVKFWGETRYVLGYNHIVHVADECDRDVWCSVSTDVNPKVQVVAVPQGTQVAVTTFLGSPSRTFTPIVSCDFESPQP